MKNVPHQARAPFGAIGLAKHVRARVVRLQGNIQPAAALRIVRGSGIAFRKDSPERRADAD
jgi:hypothetical protein